MTKKEIRDAMRKRRRAVTPAERAAASVRICEKLIALLPREGLSPTAVAVYLASPDEIDLSRFIQSCVAKGLRLVAPRWNGEAYELAELNGCWPNDLELGPHAILEPPPEASRVAAGDVGLWIVPGLAFTANGARLGYGGGWYDRMMSGTSGKRIGVAYDFQVVSSLPVEPHDLAIGQLVVSESEFEDEFEFESEDEFEDGVTVISQTPTRTRTRTKVSGFRFEV